MSESRYVSNDALHIWMIKLEDDVQGGERNDEPAGNDDPWLTGTVD